MPETAVDENAVFLNIPYDQGFRRLYVAYIAGLYHFGLKPRVTLGIPCGERRMDRILQLIESCRYSIHDLSRVQLDRTPPLTPRFNMPFELGLAIATAKRSPDARPWFVFETVKRRVSKSLSDLDGTDPYIHQGTVEGVMRELCNAFVRRSFRPKVPDMMRSYRRISTQTNALAENAASESIFAARVFEDLCVAAKYAADELIA